MRAARIMLAAGLAALVTVSSPDRQVSASGAATAAVAAPPLAFTDGSGQGIALESLRGKVVLLDIWASWCTPCRASFPAYDQLYQRYKAQGFHVLAVNVDESRKDAERFLAGRNPAMQVVFDPTGRAPAALKTKGMPTSYLIDRRGRIRFVHEGFTEKLLGEYQHEIAQLLQEAP
jgi:thiol-disulfide isomerase/thioredoxin